MASHQDILKDLKAKKYAPIYFFHGEEPYYIDVLSKYIEQNVLNESEKAFNQTIIYGKDATYHKVVDNARRFPVMSERQVMIVKEAQNMKELNKLEKYALNPPATTILVFCYKHKRFDKRSKFSKALKKKAVVFESKKLYDNQVPDWINGYLKQKGFQINTDATQLIAEYLGTNLSKVANELDKLILNVDKGSKITIQQVQANIGISKDYNVFELQKAIGQRNTVKVQRIVNYFASNPKSHPLPQIVSSLFSYFSKIYIAQFYKTANDRELATKIGTNPYFVRDYKVAMKNFNRSKTEEVIDLLKIYDLKSKGVDRVNTPDGELVRELIYKIMH